MDKPKLTVGIVVRIYIGELPYFKAFLDYYLSIGISRFYIIISDLNNFGKIKEYLKDYDLYLEYTVNNGVKLNFAFDLVLNDLKEDYILNVDADEFLHLTPYHSIQDYIDATGYGDKYTFGWLMSVNDNISKNTKAFEGKNGKQMCKREIIKGILEHKITTEGPVKEIPIIFNLIHYWGRTFNDCLIKCLLGGGHKDVKSSSHSAILKDISRNTIPNRFKLMAALSRRIKTIDIPDYITENIDYRLEEELVSSFDSKEKLFGIYKKYQESLDYKKHVAIYGEVNLIKLVPYLP